MLGDGQLLMHLGTNASLTRKIGRPGAQRKVIFAQRRLHFVTLSERLLPVWERMSREVLTAATKDKTTPCCRGRRTGFGCGSRYCTHPFFGSHGYQGKTAEA